jgi:hypothetical protein
MPFRDAAYPLFIGGFDLDGLPAVRAYQMMVMRIVLANAKHLLVVEPKSVGLTRFGEGIQLTVHGRQSNMRTCLEEQLVQILRRNKILAPTQRPKHRILLFGMSQ